MSVSVGADITTTTNDRNASTVRPSPFVTDIATTRTYGNASADRPTSLRPKIGFSIVMIVRNEEATLPRVFKCCEPFLQAGGEIVMLDTGSTDGTVAVAREHGVQVHEAGNKFAFCLSKQQARKINAAFLAPGDPPFAVAGDRIFHFGNARNAAHQLASNDVVLQLDAADVLRTFDFLRIHENILEKPSAKRWLYRLKSDNQLALVGRFYDRRVYRWFGCVHEELNMSPEGGNDVAILNVECLNVEHIRNKQTARKYPVGLAWDLLHAPEIERSRFQFHLGRELCTAEHPLYRTAIQLLEQCATAPSTPYCSTYMRNQALCYVGQCHEQLGQHDQAIQAYTRALELEPDRREPWLRLAALHLHHTKHYLKTACYTQAALAVPSPVNVPGHPMPESMENFGWRPYKLLHDALMLLGRNAEAGAYLQKARQTLSESLHISTPAEESKQSVVFAGDTTHPTNEQEPCDCSECKRQSRRSKSFLAFRRMG